MQDLRLSQKLLLAGAIALLVGTYLTLKPNGCREPRARNGALVVALVLIAFAAFAETSADARPEGPTFRDVNVAQKSTTVYPK